MPRRSSPSVRIFYPKFSKEEVVRTLSERLKELKHHLPLLQVVLFGSYARGNYTAGSDIDLLIVYRGEKREDAYALVKEVLDLPGLEPHLYTEGEYQKMQATIKAMTKEGIPLFEADSPK